MTTLLPRPTLGVDLLTDETNLQAGTVRRAENVDLSRTGEYARRAGYRVIDARADCTLLRALSGKRLLLGLADRVELRRADLTVIATAPLAAPADVLEANGNIYVVGAGGALFVRGGEHAFRPVGVRPPAVIPELAPHDAGGYLPGRYAVAVSRVDDTGEESPTVLAGQVTLAAPGAIRVEGLPVELGARYRLYVTPTDGDVLYLAEEIPAAFPAFILGRVPDGSMRATQHLRPLPGGRFVRQQGGRLYVARGNVVAFSEPMRPHLFNPGHNVIPFVGAVRLLEAVEGGLFVGDDRGVWFLAGDDPSAARLTLASPHLAALGTGLTVAGGVTARAQGAREVAAWLSEAGHCMGLPGGAVAELNANRLRFAPETCGRSCFLVRNGRKQLVTLVSAHDTHGFAVDTTIE